jgi:hypothetical protein
MKADKTTPLKLKRRLSKEEVKEVQKAASKAQAKFFKNMGSDFSKVRKVKELSNEERHE